MFGTNFILDTGTEQTAVNPMLVEGAKFKTLETKKSILTVTGVHPADQVELAALILNGRRTKPLTAVVDQDLVQASKQLSWNFGITVGMDVLSRYVISIDYPYRRLAFFEKPAHINRSSEVARFPFEVRHGQMIVKCVLPNRSRVSLAFDTGLGLDADVMLYQDAVEGVDLLPPAYSAPLIEEAVDIRVGRLPWIDFENIHVESPTVAINPRKGPNIFGEPYSPGLIGPVLFEDYTVEIDFQNHVVRVLRTKPRFQQRSGNVSVPKPPRP